MVQFCWGPTSWLVDRDFLNLFSPGPERTLVSHPLIWAPISSWRIHSLISFKSNYLLKVPLLNTTFRIRASTHEFGEYTNIQSIAVCIIMSWNTYLLKLLPISNYLFMKTDKIYIVYKGKIIIPSATLLNRVCYYNSSICWTSFKKIASFYK